MECVLVTNTMNVSTTSGMNSIDFRLQSISKSRELLVMYDKCLPDERHICRAENGQPHSGGDPPHTAASSTITPWTKS